MGIKSHTSFPRREIRQAYAERPQTLSRRSIISLGVGPLQSLAVEIDTRLPFEVRRSGDMENGVGAMPVSGRGLTKRTRSSSSVILEAIGRCGSVSR